jgi:hypothetical protein
VITSVGRLKNIIAKSSFAASHSELVQLVRDTNAILAAQKSIPAESVFLIRTIQMFSAWSSGRQNEAKVEASNLDQQSNNTFKLSNFLQTHP